MLNNSFNARPALSFYLVANAITIQDYRHQTNVTDAILLGGTQYDRGEPRRNYPFVDA